MNALALRLSSVVLSAAIGAQAAEQTQEQPPETVAQAETAAEPATEARLDVEAILSAPLDDQDYQQRRNCLRMRAIDDVEVLDDELVVFHGRQNKLWLNQLSTRCLGLREDMLVELRGYGGSICRLDRFIGRPRFSPMGAINAQCRLGSFETIDPMQVEALREAVQARRRADDMAKKTRRSRKEANE